MSLKDFLKKTEDTIKYPYTYVPPCPCCGSRMTGRYVKQKRHYTQKDVAWYMEESYKNGEIIVFVPLIEDDTAFCFNCEYRWPARIQNVMLTKKEIEKEKAERHTLELYEDLTEDDPDKNKKTNIITRFFVGRR